MKHLKFLLITLLFVTLTACAATSVATPGSTGGSDVAAPSPEPTRTDTANVTVTTGATATSTSALHNENTLKNLPYTLVSLDGKTVTLDSGEYQNPEEHIYVTYIKTVAYGDVTGDGTEDALVLLGANSGGSGIFTDLAVVTTDTSATATNIATTLLGDRVDVRDVTIADGDVAVAMVTQGPNEPMCCGTLQVTVTYRWQDGTLAEISRTENGYLNGVENFYNPDTFKNITLNSTIVPSGTITLADGTFEDDNARVIAKLDTNQVAFGDLNGDGKDEAVLLIYSNTGGSGNFTELAVVKAQDDQLVNIATTLLGDRITVYGLSITDTNKIFLDMLVQGTNDPQCCPTSHIHAEYALMGDSLEQVSMMEIETIPALGSSTLDANALTVDITGVADSIEGATVPYQPFLEGPGLEGTPEHIVYGFDGENPTFLSPMEAQLRIFPVAHYEEMFEAQGITSITDYIAALTAQLKGQSTALPAEMNQPLPFLPVYPAAQDLAANVKYIDFNGGSGYRFVTHYGQAVDVFLSGSIFYTYQGLTADGKYLIVYIQPLQTSALPATYDAVPQETFDSIMSDGSAFETYRQGVITTLNDLPADQFTPNLDALDTMMPSITVNVQ